MMKPSVRTLTASMFVLALACLLQAHGAAATAQGTSHLSATDAAPFLGEWTLALQGPNGPGTFTLSISAEKEKVTAEIGSEALAKQPIGSMALVDKSLVLNYSFTYEGNPVEAVVTLTPEKEGKTAAQIDFAGGAYVMTGTGSKKEKDKGK